MDGKERKTYVVNGVDSSLLEKYKASLEEQGVNQREALELLMTLVVDGAVGFETVERTVGLLS